MARDIDTTDDIIDSRELVENISELEVYEADDDLLGEDVERLARLKSLRDDIADRLGEDALRWGVTLVRDTYFTEYAQELADDIGAIDRNASWPLTCIDWERAARELQMDYTAFDVDNGYGTTVTYWGRE